MLSIRPEFASLIYGGKKTVELRRRAPKVAVRRVYVYETLPVGRVTGWFDVVRVSILSRRAAWQLYGRRLAISLRKFRSYLCGSKSAVLFRVGRVRRFQRGVSLKRLGLKSPHPPRSFAYLRGRAAGLG